jgi:hypothetical protein
MSTDPSTNTRFGAYRNALKALSTRTGTPLPSLVVSFGVLHELTAIVPLFGTFYAARALGVGEHIVGAVLAEGESGWVRDQCRHWVEEGDGWAERVGRRYGVFGFEKGSGKGGRDGIGVIAGDVANAVAAYAVTKVRLC